MKRWTAPKVPSWFRFILISTGFELILSSPATYGWTQAWIPAAWWFFLGKHAVLLLFVTLLAPLTLKSDGLLFSDLDFSLARWRRDATWGFLCGVGVALLLRGLKVFAARFADGAGPNPMLVSMGDEIGMDPYSMAGLVLSLGLAAPVVEELQFRVYAGESFIKSWGERGGVLWGYSVVSSLVFALFHGAGHPAYLPLFFIAGLVFSRLYAKTRSLLACVVAHGTANLLSLALAFLFQG